MTFKLQVTHYVGLDTALRMTMILDSEKLNPQYNQNNVLTIPWIAWGVGPTGLKAGRL